MNIDYHAAREAWLDALHRWLMFAVIAAGASALVDAWSKAHWIGPLVAAVCGALDLTFDLSNRARTHSMFKRQYADILAEGVRHPDGLTKLQAKIDETAGDEEPPFNALMALCFDRAERSVHGNVLQPSRLRWYHRRLMNVLRFPGHDFNA